jgi:poly(3-hydroxybutyrate) depolymerase
LWADFAQRIRADRALEMQDRVLTQGEYKMRFAYRVLGDAPRDGRSLFISMHGGGNAPTRVNDRQWENQKELYTPDEGVYVAPRAPTDTWNLWHQSHIDPLFDRLITNLVLFENVNPNRVYLMGYSAGGDGAYQLAPRMADRWAAVAMMAGHPNEASPLGLRNIGFTLHMGADDAAYNRNKVAAEWKTKLADLKKDDPGGFEHVVTIHAGKGHWMDHEDAVAVPWMATFTRNPAPAKIIWEQDDVTHDQFYWLAVPKGEAKQRSLVTAERDGQTIRVTSTDIPNLIIRCDDRLLDLDQDIQVVWNGKEVFAGKCERTIGTLFKTMAEREDAELAFTVEVTCQAPE